MVPKLEEDRMMSWPQIILDDYFLMGFFLQLPGCSFYLFEEMTALPGSVMHSSQGRNAKKPWNVVR